MATHPCRSRTQADTRTQLLNRLGFIQEHPSFLWKSSSSSAGNCQPARSLSSSSSSSARRVDLGPRNHNETFQVSLNDMYYYTIAKKISNRSWLDDRRRMVTSPSQQEHPTTTYKRKVVRFRETVDVTSIPSRYQYSERIKKCMWTNQMELQEMSLRNHLEFEYERYDWTQVILENQMHFDSITGTLIHPCHFDEASAIKWKF